MFQHMFTGISGEGPFGGSGAAGVWRSMLTDEYAKSFAKSGGIGIADQVYRTLIAQTGGKFNDRAWHRTDPQRCRSRTGDRRTWKKSWTGWSRPSRKKPRACAPDVCAMR